MRRLRKASVIVVLSLLILIMGRGELNLSAIELAAAPYRYDLLTWELSNVPDKWFHKVNNLWPWNSRSRERRLQEVQEYFEIGEEIRVLQHELAKLESRPALTAGTPPSLAIPNRDQETERLLERLDRAAGKRSRMRAGVEETLESEVSAVLAQEGLDSRIGLIFPPVDLVLSRPPRVLVVSPRDRIERVDTMLLKPDMKTEDMDGLEGKIFREQNMSALVAGIGGVATYPTIVRGDSSLRHSAVTAAHEWLHAYWFFRPLGWKFWGWTPDMNTLNETAADLAGRELGDRVYAAITGQEITLPAEPEPSTAGQTEEPEEGGFDFNQEMRKTRLKVDELLAQGKVEEAESYMEARRQLFVDHGVHIRKLNQAYFAFHGTYAASPASVSPIGGQVHQLREMTDSVGDFIRTMSGFGSYQEFLQHLSDRPASDARDLDSGDARTLADVGVAPPAQSTHPSERKSPTRSEPPER